METGLCSRCVYQRLIQNDRGSTFVMCLMSETDPEFPKYPRLPIFQCAGFVPIETGRDEKPADKPR
jgi:hypothetical protein